MWELQALAPLQGSMHALRHYPCNLPVPLYISFQGAMKLLSPQDTESALPRTPHRMLDVPGGKGSAKGVPSTIRDPTKLSPSAGDAGTKALPVTIRSAAPNAGVAPAAQPGAASPTDRDELLGRVLGSYVTPRGTHIVEEEEEEDLMLSVALEDAAQNLSSLAVLTQSMLNNIEIDRYRRAHAAQTNSNKVKEDLDEKKTFGPKVDPATLDPIQRYLYYTTPKR